MDGTVAEAQEEMDKEEVAVKMSGYLEKRGKFRLVATWKRYWFVLEGRLLLYYGSEQDYINLSACRGSINMGLVSCVRPGSTRGSKQHDGFTIEVVTRTQLIVLRMKERSVQEQWLQALLDSIGGSLQSLTGGSSGTLHFRYSMDALPTATKKEASIEEKQSTLPRPKHDSASRPHQQSIIRHIKKIGGKSYIGGLDAVLKVRNNVYGSEHHEDILENNTLNGHLHQKKAPGKVKASADSSSKDPSLKDATSCTPQLVLPQTFGETLHTPNHDSSLALDPSSGDRQADVSAHNSTGYVDTMEGHNVSNHISQMPANEETHMVNDKSYNGIPPEDGLLQNKTEGEVTENRLYHNRNRSSYEVLGTLNDQNSEPESPQPTGLAETELEYPYEDIATKSPHNSEEKHNSFTGSEDVYYSCYDKASLMEQLRNEQLDSAEPELPPRPHASPEPTENCKGLTLTDVEDDYAEYCTLDTAAPPLSPSTTSSVAHPDKKEKKRHGAWKRKKRSESVSGDEKDTKVKRKISFIHMLVEKYHKKKSKHQNETDVETVEENDGAEYAVVEYNTIQSEERDKERESVQKKDKQLAKGGDEEQTHDKSAASLCSAKSLLPNNTLQELQLRLRQRNSPHCIENSEEEPDYEAEYAVYIEIPKEQPSSETPGIARRKPVPVPRKNISKSMEELSDGPDNGSTQQTATTPPQLPQRRMIRPRSPWHDVPSNNSPVYGNCEELFGTNQRDSLLGTSERYAMVKNKWQAAEMTSSPRSKGTQWNRELRQVTFPSRLGQRALQWQEEASGDPGCGCCVHCNKEQCTQHATNIVVEKHTCEMADVDLRTDTITSGGNGNGNDELVPDHTTQPSSDVKIEPVSIDGNKITLVATVHSEESVQSFKQHDKVLDGFEMVSHGNSHHDTNAEHTEASERKEGAKATTSGETTTMNILRAGSDTQLLTDSLGECLNTDILSNTARNCDTSNDVTDSSSEEINVKQTELEEDRKPKCVEKKSYTYKSVSDIKLKIAEPCSQKNEKTHNTTVCTSIKGTISEDINPDSLMSDNDSQCSAGLSDKQEQEHSNGLLVHGPNWNICKCISIDSCENCAKKVNNKSLPDSLSSAQWNSIVHDDSLENVEEVELRKHPGVASSSNVVHTQTSDEPMCPTCSLKAASARDVILDGTKAIQCIRYDDDGCITDKQVVHVTKRYSDELNLLLAQLAEITSAPLLSPGVTISLVDFPEKRKHPGQVQGSEFDEWAAIGPIRRRRHSDPDYDVPRPHRSLLQLLLSGSEKEKTDNNDTIEATRFFGKTDPCANVIPDPDSSVGDRHEMPWHEYSESESCSKQVRNSKNLVQHQTDTPSVSITPDSLEVEQP